MQTPYRENITNRDTLKTIKTFRFITFFVNYLNCKSISQLLKINGRSPIRQTTGNSLRALKSVNAKFDFCSV